MKIGTEYIQYWIDKNKNNTAQAYKDYWGKINDIYYNKKNRAQINYLYNLIIYK